MCKGVLVQLAAMAKMLGKCLGHVTAISFLLFCLSAAHSQDEVAEWLRRWTANPFRSAGVGSNPILVDVFFFFYFYLLIFLFLYK